MGAPRVTAVRAPCFSRSASPFNTGNLSRAEALLANYSDHNAEWNFLKGAVCYRRGWLDEALRYYRTACQMDPTNAEYRQALEYMEGTDDTAYRPGGGSFGTLVRRKSLYEPVLSLGALQWRRLLVLLLRDHKRGSRDHMIKSMTGYGRARQELHKRDITVEVRSVNNRYLDCTVKMPRMYAFAEDAVKERVQQAVSRGKVDVFITVDATAADVVKVAVNRELAAQYAAALGELSDVCGTADYRPAPETLARFPDVLTVTKADEDLETVSADLCAVLGRGAGRVQ